MENVPKLVAQATEQVVWSCAPGQHAVIADSLGYKVHLVTIVAYVMAEAAQPCAKSEDIALADQSLVCWAAATKLRLTPERSSGSSGRGLSRIATTASLTEGTTMGVVIAGSLAPKHGDLN